jgi:hypothetical protein
MLCEFHGRNFNGEQVEIENPPEVIRAYPQVKIVCDVDGKKKTKSYKSHDCALELYRAYCVLPDRIVYLGEGTRIMCSDSEAASDPVVRYASWRLFEDEEIFHDRFVKSRLCGGHNEHGQEFLDAVDQIFFRNQMRKIIESLLGEHADLENREKNL